MRRSAGCLRSKGLLETALFLQTKFTPTNGQDHRTPYDASATFTTQVKQSFDSSLGPPAHRVCRLLCLARALSAAADWETRIGRCGRPSEGLYQIRENQNDRHQQCHGWATHPALCAQAEVETHDGAKPLLCRTRMGQRGAEICRVHGIIYQGFSLLTANREVFADSGIRAIAQRLGTGLAQVVFRFAMQVGMLPLTGTTNPQHMKDDLQAEQPTLTADDMRLIETIGM